MSEQTPASSSATSATDHRSRNVLRLAVGCILILVIGFALATRSSLKPLCDLALDESADRTHRCDALDKLAKERGSDITEVFVQALVSPEPWVRARAARHEYNRRDHAAIPNLIALLRDRTMIEVTKERRAEPMGAILAAKALSRITKQNFGDVFSSNQAGQARIAAAWEKWYETEYEGATPQE